MNKNIPAYTHFNQNSVVDNYTEMYENIDLNKGYPVNLQRLNIVLSLLDKIQPKKIIDAGCGAGQPLIEILKSGYNVSGYDKSENMILEAKENLSNNNFSKNLVGMGDFENPDFIKNNSVDCITGMGVFYYANNIVETIKRQSEKLSDKGHIIFSLRNKLFDLVTLNEYTSKFLFDLYQVEKFDSNINGIFQSMVGDNNDREVKDNIDTQGVMSNTHNPLTVEDELLKDANLKLNGIYFYHYHCLPPIFESHIPLEFRRESLKIENPSDWRGNFLASGFVVHAQKSK
jgi:SAM-dependent methyltransferase